MHRLVRTCLAAALVATALGTAAGPASAERWWGRDKAGDVRQLTISLDPPPCGSVDVTPAPQDTSTDLVGLSVVHDGDSVVLRAHLRGYRAPGTDRGLEFDLATEGRDYQVSVSTWGRQGPPVVELATAPTEPQPAGCNSYVTSQTSVPCDGMRLSFRPARGVVDVTVPRTCVGDPRWVRAGAHSERLLGDRGRIDVWGRTDVGTILDAPPLSPRVRHSR